MKLFSFLCVVSVCLLLFCSCQKEISDYIPPPTSDSTITDTTASDTTFLVKRYVEDIYLASAPDQHTTDSFVLGYDNQSRLLRLTSVSSPGNKFVYAYSDQSFTLDLYNNNAVSIHENFFLKNGLVDSTIQYNDEGDTSTEKYIYNSAKQVTKLYEYDYTRAGGAVLSNTITSTYDTNGDLTTTTDDISTTTYTYKSKTLNTLNDGLYYYYSVSSHLPDGLTYVSSGETYKGTHTYTFDNRKRLTVDNFQLDNGSVVEKRYYY